MSKDSPITSDPNDPRNAVEPPLDEMRARVLIARGILTIDDVITMIENGDVIVPVAEPYVQPGDVGRDRGTGRRRHPVPRPRTPG